MQKRSNKKWTRLKVSSRARKNKKIQKLQINYPRPLYIIYISDQRIEEEGEEENNMSALHIIEDNTTPNAAALDSSARKRQRVAQKPSTTTTSPSSLKFENKKFKNLSQQKTALEVYEDEEDGDKENRNPNVPSNNRRYNSNSGANDDLGGNDQMKKMKSSNVNVVMDMGDFEEATKVNTKIFKEKKTSAPRAPFVAKLYSSLPTSRVVLGDITRNHSPNRLAPGKYRIGPNSSSSGQQKRSEGDTTTNRTSILKVR